MSVPKGQPSRLSHSLTHLAFDTSGSLALVSSNSSQLRLIQVSKLMLNQTILSFNFSHYSQYSMDQVRLSKCGTYFAISFSDKLVLGSMGEKGAAYLGEIELKRKIREFGFCCQSQNPESQKYLYYLLDDKRLHLYSFLLRSSLEVEEKVDSVSAAKNVLEVTTDYKYVMVRPKHTLAKVILGKEETPVVFKKFFQKPNQQFLGCIPMGRYLVIATETPLRPSKGGTVQLYQVDLRENNKKPSTISRFQYLPYNQNETTPKQMVNLRWTSSQEWKFLIVVTEWPISLRFFSQKGDGSIVQLAEKKFDSKINHYFYHIEDQEVVIGVIYEGINFEFISYKTSSKSFQRRLDQNAPKAPLGLGSIKEEIVQSDHQGQDKLPDFPSLKIERQVTFGSPIKQLSPFISQDIGKPGSQQTLFQSLLKQGATKTMSEFQNPALFAIQPITHRQASNLQHLQQRNSSSPLKHKSMDLHIGIDPNVQGNTSVDLGRMYQQSMEFSSMKSNPNLKTLEQIMFGSDEKRKAEQIRTQNISVCVHQQDIKPTSILKNSRYVQQQQEQQGAKVNPGPIVPAESRAPGGRQLHAYPQLFKPDHKSRPVSPLVQKIPLLDIFKPKPAQINIFQQNILPVHSAPQKLIPRVQSDSQSKLVPGLKPQSQPKLQQVYLFVRSCLGRLRTLRVMLKEFNRNAKHQLTLQCQEPVSFVNRRIGLLSDSRDLLFSHHSITRDLIESQRSLLGVFSRHRANLHKIQGCFRQIQQEQSIKRLENYLSKIQSRVGRLVQRRDHLPWVTVGNGPAKEPSAWDFQNVYVHQIENRAVLL